jgi:DNA polymerase-3 subunit gamma/tau
MSAASAGPDGAATNLDWDALVARLGLHGPTRQFAAHCLLLERGAGVVRLQLDPAGAAFRRPQIEQRIAQLLTEHFGEPVRLEIVEADRVAGELLTPARREAIAHDDRQRAAEASIESDPAVRAMREVFGATVKPGSVKPLSSP